VVNGFHGGEYNDAADITVVRQRNAHAWVEVFFPKENTWVTFDPTPSSDETSGAATSGIAGAVHKYLEALETYWIQYFVAYDDQGQRSLAKSLRSGFLEYQNSLSSFTISLDSMLREWWSEVRGDKGLASSAKAAGTAAGYAVGAILAVLLVIWGYLKLRRSGIFGRFRRRIFATPESSAVEFYQRMENILAERGINREPSQTPLEFAYSTGLPATVQRTEKYNRVRFGEKGISTSEEAEIENWLDDLNLNEKG
jgi:hypothetical protein